MNFDLILFCSVGGLIYSDTDAVGQFGISQPLVSAALAGLVLGNLELGITVGILMQLPYLVELPAGGAKISVASLGSFVGSGLAVSLSQSYPGFNNLTLAVTLGFGVLTGWLTIPLQGQLRQLNGGLIKYVDLAAGSGDLRRITFLNNLSAFRTILFGVFSCAFFFVTGKVVFTYLLQLAPRYLDAKLQFVTPVILGAGIGALLWQFVKTKRGVGFSLIGVALGVLFFFSRLDA